MRKIMKKLVVVVLPMLLILVSGSYAATWVVNDRPPKPTETEIAEELIELLIHEYKRYRDAINCQGDDNKVTENVRKSLIKIGKPAVGPLISALNSRLTGTKNEKSFDLYGPRVQAAKALGGIGPDAKDAVGALIKSLDDESDVRKAAAKALGKIGPDAKKAVDVLVKILDTYDHEVREAAAEALGEIGPASVQVVPALAREALNDSWNSAQEASIVALGKIGPKAKPATAVLRIIADRLNRNKILKNWNQDQHLSLLAARSLLQINSNDKAVAKSLVNVLDYDTNYRRNNIIDILMEVGKELEPELRVALKGKQQGSREYKAIDDILERIEQKSGRFRVKLASKETAKEAANEKAIKELNELF